MLCLVDISLDISLNCIEFSIHTVRIKSWDNDIIIISLLYTQCNQLFTQRVEGTLIYADIGPATVRSTQSSASISLDLDASHMHVQYAQINLKMLEQESPKSKELHAESETKDKFNGKLN